MVLKDHLQKFKEVMDGWNRGSIENHAKAKQEQLICILDAIMQNGEVSKHCGDLELYPPNGGVPVRIFGVDQQSQLVIDVITGLNIFLENLQYV